MHLLLVLLEIEVVQKLSLVRQLLARRRSLPLAELLEQHLVGPILRDAQWLLVVLLLPLFAFVHVRRVLILLVVAHRPIVCLLLHVVLVDVRQLSFDFGFGHQQIGSVVAVQVLVRLHLVLQSGVRMRRGRIAHQLQLVGLARCLSLLLV